ncbi:MAG: hypothetical protein D6706_06745, partial [Chloroflexi bacterium]
GNTALTATGYFENTPYSLSFGIYSDAGFTTPITSANPGDTVYIKVVSGWGNLTGDKKTEIKVSDYLGATVKSTLTLSGNNPWTYTYTIPNNFGNSQLYFEANIQDNDGDQAKAAAHLDITGQSYYIKLYCDNTYTTECNTFGDGETIYVEMVGGVNSTPDWGSNGKSKLEVNNFFNQKYQWTNFGTHSQNGTTYRFTMSVDTMTANLSMTTGNWYFLKPKLQSSGGTKIYDKGEIAFFYDNITPCTPDPAPTITSVNVNGNPIDICTAVNAGATNTITNYEVTGGANADDNFNDNSLDPKWSTELTGTTGAVTETGGQLVITNTGSDLWNTNNQYSFAYQTVSGDFSATVKVASLVNTNAWAKAGILIKNDLDSNTTYPALATIEITPGNGASFQWRTNDGDTTMGYTSAGGETAPEWLRLVKTGNSITAYYSNDGTNFTQVGAAQTINFSGNVLLGLM